MKQLQIILKGKQFYSKLEEYYYWIDLIDSYLIENDSSCRKIIYLGIKIIFDDMWLNDYCNKNLYLIFFLTFISFILKCLQILFIFLKNDIPQYLRWEIISTFSSIKIISIVFRLKIFRFKLKLKNIHRKWVYLKRKILKTS